MYTDADFLARILEAPDDDTPRLVYADFLDESGRERGRQHAAMIRHQCRTARTPHQHRPGQGFPCPRCVLEKESRRFNSWACDHLIPPQLIGRCTFRRGFAAEVVTTSAVWVKVAGAVVGRHPLRAVVIDSFPGTYLPALAAALVAVPRVLVCGVPEDQRVVLVSHYRREEPLGNRAMLEFEAADHYTEYAARNFLGGDGPVRALVRGYYRTGRLAREMAALARHA